MFDYSILLFNTKKLQKFSLSLSLSLSNLLLFSYFFITFYCKVLKRSNKRGEGKKEAFGIRRQKKRKREEVFEMIQTLSMASRLFSQASESQFYKARFFLLFCSFFFCWLFKNSTETVQKQY